eukprot:scaffold19206_cov93-Skeletonema_marinoi.AAC.1
MVMQQFNNQHQRGLELVERSQEQERSTQWMPIIHLVHKFFMIKIVDEEKIVCFVPLNSL